MNQDVLIIIGRVAGARAIGAMIGLERSVHGRPAGFRLALFRYVGARLPSEFYAHHMLPEILEFRIAPTGD